MSHATPRPTVRFPPDGDLPPTLDPRAPLDDGDHFPEDQPIEFQRTLRPQHRQDHRILVGPHARVPDRHNRRSPQPPRYGHEDLGDITRRVKVYVPEYDGKLDPNIISSQIGWITWRTILIGMACLT
jgi:hypothetical protein